MAGIASAPEMEDSSAEDAGEESSVSKTELCVSRNRKQFDGLNLTVIL